MLVSTACGLFNQYFGQLKFPELRFVEFRVNYLWRDAFNNKPITQTSTTHKKTSVVFQIAAIRSAVVIVPDCSDPEGFKRAFERFTLVELFAGVLATSTTFLRSSTARWQKLADTGTLYSLIIPCIHVFFVAVSSTSALYIGLSPHIHIQPCGCDGPRYGNLLTGMQPRASPSMSL